MSAGHAREWPIAPTRRAFLRLACGAAGLVAAPALVGCVAGSGTSWRNGNPFSLGVASGDPAPDGFVLWTRLAPDPLAADPTTPGGMSGGAVTLGYEIASDPTLRTIVQRGTAIAEPRFAYSTHLEVTGLAPGRPYWYRFTSGDAASRIGRAITAPAPGAKLDRLRFAFASCSHYEYGYFSAYRHLTDESPDLVLFLGDYIYEFTSRRRPTLRQHSDGVTATTLPTYRNRYAQYRTDPDLQRLHAEITALTTWDDHEVQNDYADQWSETFDPPEKFLLRRAAAYQAFYEHMPLRPSRSLPNGPAMRLYERFAFGDLVEFSMIDGRQYRSREACYRRPNLGGGHLESAASCPELIDPARSMIGLAQEQWLFDGLARSPARWNVIAQDVLMAQLRETDREGTKGFWTDNWNGYPASRARLLQHIHDSKVANPVVIGGDIHSFWNNDLKLDFDDPASPTVATELVGTSITSPGVPYELFASFLPENPHVRFFESRKRGYVMVELARDRMTARFQTISDVADPQATLSTLRSFTIEDGRAGALV